MRRMFCLTSLAALLAVALGPGALLVGAVQDMKAILMRGLDANKPVTIRTATGTSQTTTGAAGDLSAALDPNQQYVVYKRECSRYDIVDQSIDNGDCDSNQQAGPNGECRSCEIAGLISNGTFHPRTARRNFIRTKTGLVTTAGAAAALWIGLAAGGDSSASNNSGNNSGTNNSGGGIALTSLVNRVFQGSLPCTANGCNLNVSNPATLRAEILTVTPDASGNSATGTGRIVHVLVNTTFSGPIRLTRNSNGTLALVFDPATGSGYTSIGQGTINAAGNQLASFSTTATNTANCAFTYTGTLNQ